MNKDQTIEFAQQLIKFEIMKEENPQNENGQEQAVNENGSENPRI